MEVNMLKLRLTLISDRSLDEGILLKPSLVPPPPASEDDDEDRIELLERMLFNPLSCLLKRFTQKKQCVNLTYRTVRVVAHS